MREGLSSRAQRNVNPVDIQRKTLTFNGKYLKLLMYCQINPSLCSVQRVLLALRPILGALFKRQGVSVAILKDSFSTRVILSMVNEQLAAEAHVARVGLHVRALAKEHRVAMPECALVGEA